MNLANVTVRNILDQPETQLINAIMIAGKRKSFYVFAEENEDKMLWLKLLQDTISDLVRQKSTLQLEPTEDDDAQAPVWIPDESVEWCLLCKGQWTFLNRRHHCRRCGSVICGDCSKKSMVIPSYSKKPVRVCDSCFGNSSSTSTVK